MTATGQATRADVPAGGAVPPCDATCRTHRACRNCAAEVHYHVPASAWHSGWKHAGAVARCDLPGLKFADPVPQCPKCESGAYTVTQTNWGIQSDCPACGYSHYFSIGD